MAQGFNISSEIFGVRVIMILVLVVLVIFSAIAIDLVIAAESIDLLTIVAVAFMDSWVERIIVVVVCYTCDGRLGELFWIQELFNSICVVEMNLLVIEAC